MGLSAAQPTHQYGELAAVLFGQRSELNSNALARPDVANHSVGANLAFADQEVQLGTARWTPVSRNSPPAPILCTHETSSRPLQCQQTHTSWVIAMRELTRLDGELVFCNKRLTFAPRDSAGNAFCVSSYPNETQGNPAT